MREATRIATLATLSLELLESGDHATVKKNLADIAHRAIDLDARTGRMDPRLRKTKRPSTTKRAKKRA